MTDLPVSDKFQKLPPFSILNSEKISAAISNIRKKNPQTYNNYYFQPLPSDVTAYISDETLVFLKPEFDFFRLYFISSNLSELSFVWNGLPRELEIYLEYICKNQPEPELSAVINQNFVKAAVYQKMSKAFKALHLRENAPNNQVSAEEIFQKVYQTFNIYYDHLTSFEEIKQLSDANQIITIYENGELQSFIIYKIQGRQAYINHIANYGTKQNLLDLWAKFYQTMHTLNINQITLWYDHANAKAINMYTIEQFKNLNQLNYIYKLK